MIAKDHPELLAGHHTGKLNVKNWSCKNLETIQLQTEAAPAWSSIQDYSGAGVKQNRQIFAGSGSLG